MSDEEIINEEPGVTEQPQAEEKPQRSDNRFKDLSEKVKTTAEERDRLAKEAEEAKKEAEFYKSFNKASTKYQEAGNYQDKIKDKVMAGYDMEDAMVAVLAKEGKLNTTQINQSRQSPAGGSASTAMRSTDDKPVGEMTTAEKREKLLEFERENPGQLGQTLRSINL